MQVFLGAIDADRRTKNCALNYLLSLQVQASSESAPFVSSGPLNFKEIKIYGRNEGKILVKYLKSSHMCSCGTKATRFWEIMPTLKVFLMGIIFVILSSFLWDSTMSWWLLFFPKSKLPPSSSSSILLMSTSEESTEFLNKNKLINFSKLCRINNN